MLLFETAFTGPFPAIGEFIFFFFIKIFTIWASNLHLFPSYFLSTMVLKMWLGLEFSHGILTGRKMEHMNHDKRENYYEEYLEERFKRHLNHSHDAC
jgi:hypothetical protein